MSIPSDLEPTTFCNECAQRILAHIDPLVPKPPCAVTYEQGVRIVDAVQAFLYPRHKQ